MTWSILVTNWSQIFIILTENLWAKYQESGKNVCLWCRKYWSEIHLPCKCKSFWRFVKVLALLWNKGSGKLGWKIFHQTTTRELGPRGSKCPLQETWEEKRCLVECCRTPSIPNNCIFKAMWDKKMIVLALSQLSNMVQNQKPSYQT